MHAHAYPRPENLDHLVRILSSFTNYEKNRDFHKGRIRCDLEKMESLCRAAGDPQHAVPCVHITGSKGKGSTALMLDALLRSQGLKTGLFTSPHLIDLTERIAVNGEPLSGKMFVETADRTLQVLRDHADLKPTFFEFVTAQAMIAFRDLDLQAAVYEVGLGGRLDATCVVTPVASVITTVELEHTAILGDTLEQIAWEKAGIIEQGVPVITALPSEHPGRPVIEKEAQALQAPLLAPGRGLEIVSLSEDAGIMIELDGREYGPYQPPAPRPLQAWNLVCALAAARTFCDRKGLDWDDGAAREALSGFSLPGRFEIMRREPLVVIDGAHTPASVEAGFQEASRLLGGPPVVILGLADDKNAQGVLEALPPGCNEIPGCEHLFFTTYPGGRALPVARLQDLAGGRGEQTAGPEEALKRALKAAGPKGAVLVTGSFYLAGTVRALLLRDRRASG